MTGLGSHQTLAAFASAPGGLEGIGISALRDEAALRGAYTNVGFSLSRLLRTTVCKRACFAAT